MGSSGHGVSGLPCWLVLCSACPAERIMNDFMVAGFCLLQEKAFFQKKA